MGILNAKLNFAFLCDYASISREGKLSMNGIFENINAKIFPAVHPVMYIVANVSGINARDKFTCELVKEDGLEIRIATIQAEVAAENAGRNFGFIGQFVNIKYDKPGNYLIKFYIDNREIGIHRFQINAV